MRLEKACNGCLFVVFQKEDKLMRLEKACNGCWFVVCFRKRIS